MLPFEVAFSDIEKEIADSKKRKKADRIAFEAERKQRYAKGRKFK